MKMILLASNARYDVKYFKLSVTFLVKCLVRPRVRSFEFSGRNCVLYYYFFCLHSVR